MGDVVYIQAWLEKHHFGKYIALWERLQSFLWERRNDIKALDSMEDGHGYSIVAA